MKKCMIAAVAAVVASGAFAACSRGQTEDKSTCPNQTWVYTWKFTGTTTEGAKVAEKDIVKLCGRSTGKAGEVRVPASLEKPG